MWFILSHKILDQVVSGRFTYESFRLLSVRLRLKLCTSALQKDPENSNWKAFKMK